MSNSKDTIEDIKNDIKNLLNNITKLKGSSGDIWSESLDEFKNLLAGAKDEAKSRVPAGKILYKGVDFMYGDTIKKALAVVGVAAITLYLFNRE